MTDTKTRRARRPVLPTSWGVTPRSTRRILQATPSVYEPRRELGPAGRRAGWQGFYYNLSRLPPIGIARVYPPASTSISAQIRSRGDNVNGHTNLRAGHAFGIALALNRERERCDDGR